MAEAIDTLPLLLDAKTVRRITGLTQNNLNYLAHTGAIRTIVPGKRNRKYYRKDIVNIIEAVTGEKHES